MHMRNPLSSIPCVALLLMLVAWTAPAWPDTPARPDSPEENANNANNASNTDNPNNADNVDPVPAMLLMANPGLKSPFSGAVIAVGTLPGDRHLGVIVNRPTKVTLKEVLPETLAPRHPEQTVRMGGPARPNELFAVVRGDQPPETTIVAFASNLFLVGDAKAVDELMRTESKEEVRYFVGLVMWERGQLLDEWKRGLWSYATVDSTELFGVMNDDGVNPEDPSLYEFREPQPMHDFSTDWPPVVRAFD